LNLLHEVLDFSCQGEGKVVAEKPGFLLVVDLAFEVVDLAFGPD